MDKPIPGELRNVDVQMVSLVDKGANRRQFKIFKSADYPEEVQTQEPEEQQYKGLFQVLKEFFRPKKQDESQGVQIPTFTQAMQIEATDDMVWQSFSTLRDVIRTIIASDAADKSARINAAVEEFKAYLLGTLNQIGITKALELYQKENFVKAGRKISAARLKALKDAHNLLAQIISEAEADNQDEEGTQVTKEELSKMVVEAVNEATKPISERLEKLEKQADGNQAGDTAQGKEELQNIIKETVSKAVKPLEDRLEVVEKARGISNKIPEGKEPVEKSDFWGGAFLS